MKWTDGMEYHDQLTKIAKTDYCGRGDRSCKCCVTIAYFNWIVMSSLCFLALYPAQAHAQNVLRVDEAMFGTDNIIHGFGSMDAR